MKFKIRRLSNNNYLPHDLAYEYNDEKWLIDINSMKQLIEICEDIDEDVIIRIKNSSSEDKPELLIYDDFME